MWRMNKGIVKDLLPQAPLPPQIGGWPCAMPWSEPQSASNRSLVWAPQPPPHICFQHSWDLASLVTHAHLLVTEHVLPPLCLPADPWWVVHVVNLTEGEYRQLDPAGKHWPLRCTCLASLLVCDVWEEFRAEGEYRQLWTRQASLR